MNSSQTPWTWGKRTEHGPYTIEDNQSRIIAALIDGRPKEEMRANAKLLAIAPELLVVAKDFVLFAGQHERLGHLKSDPRVEKARQLIAEMEA